MGQHASLPILAVEENCLDAVEISFLNASHAPAGATLGEPTREDVSGQVLILLPLPTSLSHLL